ncbi:MAG: UDP-N-acetylenolpyruvoylglucosamine reductase [Acidimicrobiales bacterium]|nr:UDP-N-acetylenolpyruvoylglucosamine reductase [Acidimicrobiales bacterium]
MSDGVERAAALLGHRARRDVALGPLTTYRVGGPAALFVEVAGDDDLARVAEVVRTTGIDVLVVGKGSNLLVADAGFPGLAVMLGERFAGVEVDGLVVRAGGSTPLPVLARQSVAAGLTGLEWAVGVPGSVGGGVRMNAGGHGSDMAASLQRVRVLDLATGEDGVVPVAALELGYRQSAVTSTHVVVWAEFALEPGDPDAGAAELAEIVRWRREHQPGGQNAGSVFTNPPDDSAGRLVDLAGCKGLRRGSAHVSEKHANFIQADPGGRADDVASLVAEVQARVESATGVRLHRELRLVGFEPLAEVEG